VIDRRLLRVSFAAALLLTVPACSTGGSGQPARTVVVTRTKTAPPSTLSSTATGTTAPSGTPTAAPTALRQLPGTCDDLLPTAAVDDALGRSLGGRTAFVVGLPEKDIGRLGYLNCRYGLANGSPGTDAGAVAKAEIGVSLYKDAQSAAARIPATVDDYVAHGATSSTTQVDGLPATVLTGGAGAGYADPTLVVASGQRTVAVSMHEKAGAQATKDLTALAHLALTQTGG
jgi:hypothetical protein